MYAQPSTSPDLARLDFGLNSAAEFAKSPLCRVARLRAAGVHEQFEVNGPAVEKDGTGIKARTDGRA